MLGSKVTVTIDRPMGSTHPKFPQTVYPINYGYIKGLIAGDGMEQDAYVLGVDKPLNTFTGKVIAVVKRLNDVEDKLVVAPEGAVFTAEQILKAVEFQEKYFKIQLITRDITQLTNDKTFLNYVALKNLI